MIFVVRMDIKLQLSKMAECVATGALAAYKKIEALIDVDQFMEHAFYQWTESGTRKIVVKAQSEKELLDVVEEAKKKNINFYLVYEDSSKIKPENEKQVPQKKQKK